MNAHTNGTGWPTIEEMDKLPTIGRHNIPAGTVILGLAPIGVRWEGRAMGNGRIKPNRGCPVREFAPLYALMNEGTHQIQ